MLAQRSRLLEHADVEVGKSRILLLLLPDESRQLDRAGEPRGARPDEQHVHLDRLGARRLIENQLVERQAELVSLGKDRHVLGGLEFEVEGQKSRL